MASEKLEIIIIAKDRASKTLGKLGGGLTKLTSLIVGGAPPALSASLALAGAKLISMGSDAEEMMAKFDKVFGPLATQFAGRFDEMADRLGRNKYELREFGAAFQDTFYPLGFARHEAAGLSERLTELTVDLASFNNEAEPDVMNALQSAIVGNHETMRKYGVIITQTALNEQLLKDGIEGGISAATEQEKVMARLALIMAGTTDAQGDAEETAGSWANTAGSWANQMRALKSEISEAATSMGLDLLPVVTPFLENAREMAQELIPLLTEKFADFASELSERGGPAVEKIKDSIRRIAEALGYSNEEMSDAEFVASSFGSALDSIVTIVEGTATAVEKLAGALEWMQETGVLDFIQTLSAATGAGPLMDLLTGEGAMGQLTGGQGLFGGTESGGGGQQGPQQQQPPINITMPPITVTMDGEKVAELVSRRQSQRLAGTLAVGGPVAL
jgi:hypothetical protein